MSFDSIPEDRRQSYPCPRCSGGKVEVDSDGAWSCDECDFGAQGSDMHDENRPCGRE